MIKKKGSSIIAVTSRSFSKNTFLRNELESRYENVFFNDQGQSLEGDDLISFLKSANKVIVGLEIFDKYIFSNLPNLEVISKYGVGLNNIDINELKQRNIRLGLTPGVNKRPVAELTLLLMLISLRKIHNSLINIKHGIWSQDRGNELSNKIVGIIGYGNIGKLLKSFLRPFDCKILVYDIDEIDDKDIEQNSLEDIFSKADLISIHLPLLETTKNIVDKKILEISKKNLKIVNTSRGGIVNEKDLLDFLQQNKDAFAALDVFEVEPAFSSPLLELDNFFATSHLGSMTEEGVVSMGLAAIEGLEKNSLV